MNFVALDEDKASLAKICYETLMISDFRRTLPKNNRNLDKLQTGGTTGLNQYSFLGEYNNMVGTLITWFYTYSPERYISEMDLRWSIFYIDDFI